MKALYKYEPSGPVDMAFEAGDIIGVFATPVDKAGVQDGWWHGELVDEKKRVPGKYSLPSNFVMLIDHHDAKLRAELDGNV